MCLLLCHGESLQHQAAFRNRLTLSPLDALQEEGLDFHVAFYFMTIETLGALHPSGVVLCRAAVLCRPAQHTLPGGLGLHVAIQCGDSGVSLTCN